MLAFLNDWNAAIQDVRLEGMHHINFVTQDRNPAPTQWVSTPEGVREDWGASLLRYLLMVIAAVAITYILHP